MAQLYQKGADPQQPTKSLTINTAKKQQHLQPQVKKLFLKATPNQYTAQNSIIHKKNCTQRCEMTLTIEDQQTLPF